MQVVAAEGLLLRGFIREASQMQVGIRHLESPIIRRNAECIGEELVTCEDLKAAAVDGCTSTSDQGDGHLHIDRLWLPCSDRVKMY